MRDERTTEQIALAVNKIADNICFDDDEDRDLRALAQRAVELQAEIGTALEATSTILEQVEGLKRSSEEILRRLIGQEEEK